MTSRRLTLQLSLVAAAGLSVATLARTAQACAAPEVAPTIAFPATGAVDVAPESSILVRSSVAGLTGLALEANGQAIPIAGVDELGPGRANRYFRVRAALSPSMTYTLRAQDSGMPVELTRFTTTAASSNAGGGASKLAKLELWSVRYSRINSAACVFSETEGYIDLHYQPGAIAGTPPADVVSVLTLTPKGGGPAQTFAFTGLEPLRLGRTWGSFGKGAVDPSMEEFPSSIHASWKPQLEPGREYCVTVALHGRDERATALATSEAICASVTALATGSQSGCAVGGAPGASWPVVGLLGLALRRLARRRDPLT